MTTGTKDTIPTEWEEFLSGYAGYDQSVLLEREIELEVLTSMIDDLATSGGKVVLIRGEAGIGKSALAAELVRLRSESAHFIWGWCDDLSTPEPLGPIWDMARGEPDLSQALAGGERMTIMETLLDLLSRRLRPTVLVIEDTQWADEATTDVIKYVGRRIKQTGGLLILTYRDGEMDLDHPLRRVIGQIQPDSLSRIHLRPLSRDAVASLIDDAVFDIDQMLELTAGNPLFVSELLAGTPEEVPASVRDSVLARMSRLSQGARALLELTSVVPGRCEQRVIEAVLDASSDELAECVRLGLLKVEGSDVFYAHEVARQAVESALDVATRQDLNKRVLEALRANESPSRLAHHAVGAGDVSAIVEFCPIAARNALELGSIREALAHFRSLEPVLDEIPAEDRATIVDDWARVEFYLDYDGSAGILDRAIELYRSSDDELGLARALTFAVRVNELTGRPAEAEKYADQALAILDSEVASPDLAFALGQRGWLAMMRSQNDTALEFVDRSLEMAESLDDELTAIYSLNTRGVVCCMNGDPEGITMLEAARSRAEAGGFRFEEVRALNNLATVSVERMDLDAAIGYTLQARDLAARYEMRVLEACEQVMYAELELARGDWAAAADLAIDLVDSLPHSDVTARLVMGRIHARAGRPEAREHLDQSWKLAERSGEPQYQFAAGAAVAEAIWITGDDPSDLLPTLSELLENTMWTGEVARGDLALWLWELGKLEDIPPDIAEPYSLLMSGRADASASEWERLGRPYEQAMALMHTDTDGRLQALQILEGLGADAVAAKLRKELRNEGVVAPRGKALSTRGNAAGLTARQAEVLELLDEGLSNSEIADRLFVSPRTVENHVSMVLAKLDVSSREEAVARARAEGLLAEREVSLASQI